MTFVLGRKGMFHLKLLGNLIECSIITEEIKMNPPLGCVVNIYSLKQLYSRMFPAGKNEILSYLN